MREHLDAIAVAVEEQVPPSASQLASVRPWGAVSENLLNMRMQMASMHSGVELMRRHASTMQRRYDAFR
jgi:hypothetical protein